jgi:hypothetical protein
LGEALEGLGGIVFAEDFKKGAGGVGELQAGIGEEGTEGGVRILLCPGGKGGGEVFRLGPLFEELGEGFGPGSGRSGRGFGGEVAWWVRAGRRKLGGGVAG